MGDGEEEKEAAAVRDGEEEKEAAVVRDGEDEEEAAAVRDGEDEEEAVAVRDGDEENTLTTKNEDVWRLQLQWSKESQIPENISFLALSCSCGRYRQQQACFTDCIQLEPFALLEKTNLRLLCELCLP